MGKPNFMVVSRDLEWRGNRQLTNLDIRHVHPSERCVLLLLIYLPGLLIF